MLTRYSAISEFYVYVWWLIIWIETNLFYFFPAACSLKFCFTPAASIVLHPDIGTEGSCHNRHMPAVPTNPANYCFPAWKYSIYPLPGEITHSEARQWNAACSYTVKVHMW